MSIIIPRRRLLMGVASLLAAPPIVRPNNALAQFAVIGQQGSMGGGSATTTWNPSDKNAGITLSNSNLTATSGAGSQSVRSIASQSTGKMYCEGVITKTSNPGFGIANSSQSLSSSIIGNTTNSVGIIQDGRVFLNNVQIANFSGSFASGTTWAHAVDLVNMRMWWRHSNWANGWNNNASANPATNTNGVDISGLATGPYFVIWNGNSAADSMVMNFGGSAYTWLPSGFGSW